RGIPVVAGATAGVFGHEVVARPANGAAVVESFRRGVAEQRGQVGAESLAELNAEAVVIADAVVFEELDASGAKLRIGHASEDWGGAGQGLGGIDQIGRVAAKGAVVAAF